MNDLELMRLDVALKFFFPQRVPAPLYIGFISPTGSNIMDIAKKATESGEGAVNIFHHLLYRQTSPSFDLHGIHLCQDFDLIGDAEMLFVASHASLHSEWKELDVDVSTLSGSQMWRETIASILDISKLSVDPLKIWQNRHDVLARVESMQSQFCQRFHGHYAKLEEFQRLAPLKQSQPLALTRITYTASASHLNQWDTLEGMFDAMKATRHVPLIQCPGVKWSKLYSQAHFLPKQDDLQQVIFAFIDAWDDTSPSPWTCHRSESDFPLTPPSLEKGRFTKCLVHLDEERVQLTLFHQPLTSQTKKAACLTNLLKRWNAVFANKIHFDPLSVQEQGVTAALTFPVTFNPLLLYHLLTTHPQLANHVIFDQWQRPLHLAKSMDVIDKETGMTLKFSTGLLVKIAKCKQVQDIEKMRWLGKLMALLKNANEEQVFSSLIPLASKALQRFFKSRQKVVTVPEIVPPLGSQWGLRQFASDIFLPKYTRHCFAAPSIVVDPVEIERLKKQEVQLMTFPKIDDGITPQFIYTCHYNSESMIEKKRKFIYPGLMVNPLANKEAFPFTPCCFTNDQINKSGHKKASRYQEYYGTEGIFRSVLKRKKTDGRIHSGSAILTLDQVGRLPPHINTLLQVSWDASDLTFVRRGCGEPSPDAFFSCLSSLVPVAVEKDRKIMAQRHALLCLPFNPTSTLEEIQEAMLHGPFLPSQFQPAIECYYGISLFVFGYACTELGKCFEGQGEWLLPLESPILFNALDPSKPSLSILQHWGVAGDALSFPHCERIEFGQEQRGTLQESRALFSGEPVTRLETVRKDMTLTFAVKDSIMHPIPLARSLQLPSPFSVTAQCFDASRRCVAVILQPLSVLFLHTPRPPLANTPLCSRIKDTFLRMTSQQPPLQCEEGVIFFSLPCHLSEVSLRLSERDRDMQMLMQSPADPRSAFVMLWKKMRKARGDWNVPQTVIEATPQEHTQFSLDSNPPCQVITDTLSTSLSPPYLMMIDKTYWMIHEHVQGETPCFINMTQHCTHSHHEGGAFIQKGNVTAFATPLKNVCGKHLVEFVH